MKKILISIIVLFFLLTINVFAIHKCFLKPTSKGKLNFYPDFELTQGLTESVNLYTEFGLLDNLEIHLDVPQILYVDSSETDAINTSPVIGILTSLSRHLSLIVDYTLPIVAPRGFQIDTGIVYYVNLAQHLDFFAQANVPIEYINDQFGIAIYGIPGLEFNKKNFLTQIYLSMGEELAPNTQFQMTSNLHMALGLGWGKPYAEFNFDIEPANFWRFVLGIEFTI
ncbi:MAG: hypothetical protein ABIA04_15930 [Pseudomonadota bacterium]